MLLLAARAIAKIPGYSRLNSLEAKGNHPADISAKNATLKETNSQISVIFQRELDNFEIFQMIIWKN